MQQIELISRAVILHKGQILLCHNKKASHFYLPGGHIELGETAERALKRELKEEMRAKTTSSKLIGIIENKFIQKGRKHHEVNLVYEVKLKSYSVKAAEKHLEFSWHDLTKLPKLRVLPLQLRKHVSKWIKNRKFFS